MNDDNSERRSKASKLNIGEKRGSDRRDEVARQQLTLLYLNLYLPAYENACQDSEPSNKKKLFGLSNETNADGPEAFTVKEAIFDAKLGSKKSIQKFALEMARRGLVIDENGKQISERTLKKIKWA